MEKPQEDPARQTTKNKKNKTKDKNMKKFKRYMEILTILGNVLDAWKWFVIMLF